MAILSDLQIRNIRSVMDDMLDEWGKTCKVFYPPIMENCSHCLQPASSTYWNSAGLHGGPIVDFCSFCNNTGKRQKEVTENIVLEIDWTNKLNRQNWIVDADSVKRPYDVITVKGYLTDLPKLQKSIEVQINLPSFPHTAGKYVLMGDGESPFAIVEDRYFLASLKRQS